MGDLQTAALGLATPHALAEAQAATAPGAARSAAVSAACALLPREALEVVDSMCERVQQDRLPLLSLLQVIACFITLIACCMS